MIHTNQRNYSRIHLGFPVRISTVTNRLDLQVVDISMTGIRLLKGGLNFNLNSSVCVHFGDCQILGTVVRIDENFIAVTFDEKLKKDLFMSLAGNLYRAKIAENHEINRYARDWVMPNDNKKTNSELDNFRDY